MLGLLLALAAVPDVVVRAPSPFGDAARLRTSELAAMRGGFTLPNGLVVQLGIDIQTRVDGVVALHTIYESDGPDAGIRVYAGGPDPAPAASGAPQGQAATIPIQVMVDRSPAGTAILPPVQLPATAVTVVSTNPSSWPGAAGEAQLPVRPNGPPVQVPLGAVRLSRDAGGSVVTLAGPDLQVEQLIGRASGLVVANTADNRTIDTVASINVNLQGFSPQMLSNSLAMERLAADLVTRR